MKTAVLVIDDNKSVLKIMKSQLQKLKYEVILAESGKQGLSKLESELIDIVLLDQIMPEMDGMETMEQIINQKSNNAPPVIMVTGHSSLHLGISFMKIGGTDFIEKPVDYKILDIKINRAINESELKRKLQIEEIARDKAEESDNLKSNLLDLVNHEIMEPLNNIREVSYALWGSGGKLDENIKKLMVQNIYELSIDLKNLLSNILEVAKIETGREIKTSKMYLYDIIAHLKKNKAESKGLDMEIDISGDLPAIKADKNALIRVVNGLIGNAIKYTKEGSIKITVGEEKKNIVLSVKDTGIGISEEYIYKIFERFEKIETPNIHSGAGVGLYLAKNIMEHMKGQIWVESKPDQGSSFFISIPKWKQ